MPVQYALYPNHLTESPNDHRAVVKHSKSLSREDIIDQMISRGSTVTRADALATLENYEAAITSALAGGHRVNTPLINYSLSIKGTFTDAQDYFNADRHNLHINCNCGKRLKKLSQQVSLERVDGKGYQPRLDQFRDLSTDTYDKWITPGGIAMLSGRYLGIDLADDRQGLFFVGPDNKNIRVEQLIRNKPSELIFTIPDTLSAKRYTLRVANKPKNTVEIRTGRLDADLFVE